MSSSVLHMFMSEKTTDMGPPIGHPSIYLIKLSLVENTDSFVNFTNKFLKKDFVDKGFNSLLVYMGFRIYSICSATGILVQSDSSL